MATVLDVPKGSDDADGLCWICFEGPEGDKSSDPLIRVCKCPTRVHRRCIARWQLCSAGKKEERSCRFCSSELPDWKQVLTHPRLSEVVPAITVYYGPGRCKRIKVKPGPNALNEFKSQLQKVTGRPCVDQDIMFQCRNPDTGEDMRMQGLEAFEAMLHCACVQAAQHKAPKRRVLQPRATASAAAAHRPDHQEQQQQHQQYQQLHQEQQQPGPESSSSPPPCDARAGSSTPLAMLRGSSDGAPRSLSMCGLTIGIRKEEEVASEGSGPLTAATAASADDDDSGQPSPSSIPRSARSPAAVERSTLHYSNSVGLPLVAAAGVASPLPPAPAQPHMTLAAGDGLQMRRSMRGSSSRDGVSGVLAKLRSKVRRVLGKLVV